MPPICATKASGSPLPWLLLLLSVSTGMVDAISVLGLGQVFTANMTGNIVFLGFATAGTPNYSLAPYLTAISAFLVGAVAAGCVGKSFAIRPLRAWLLVSAALEAGLLWCAALVAIAFGRSAPGSKASALIIIALTAIAMGFRNGTIRQFKVPDLTTTVLTLTLTGLAADSRLSGGNNPNWQRRLSGVAAILLGAGIGALMLRHLGITWPLFLAGGLTLVSSVLAAIQPRTAHPLTD